MTATPMQRLAFLCLIIYRAMMITAFRSDRLVIRSIVGKTRLSSSSLDMSDSIAPPRKIAVVGGGLAGLSTAFHLLDKTRDLHVTVFDKAEVGTGGASSVAGGLVHPLSPRGKLVHWGLEGLKATNKLVQEACDATMDRQNHQIVLCNEIHRVALTDQHVTQLQKTAAAIPELCEWLDSNEIRRYTTGSSAALGGICLHNGCKVIHLPSYLQGLWAACQRQGREKGGSAEWKIAEMSIDDRESKQWWSETLNDYDAVVFAAGSGLFSSLLPTTAFPVQLVRGQSVEIQLSASSEFHLRRAFLCGKYISPLPEKSRALVGATHEFKKEALAENDVISQLKEKTYPMAPFVWDYGQVYRLTSGYRVQSERGKYGRMPIIGKLSQSMVEQLHPNAWIFTGLSSRGLLYHGLYGDILTGAILDGSEEPMLSRSTEIAWWRKSS